MVGLDLDDVTLRVNVLQVGSFTSWFIMNLVFFWLNWKFLCSLYKKGRGLLQKSYLRILFSANFAEHIFSIWILAFFLHLSFMELFRSIVYQQKKSALRFFFYTKIMQSSFSCGFETFVSIAVFFRRWFVPWFIFSWCYDGWISFEHFSIFKWLWKKLRSTGWWLMMMSSCDVAWEQLPPVKWFFRLLFYMQIRL